MTPEQLAAIEARDRARTPGEWQWTSWRDESLYKIESDNGMVCEREFLSHSLITTAVKDDGFDDRWVLRAMNEGSQEIVNFLAGFQTDAAFIAACSTDVPALCAALRAAWAEVERLRAIVREIPADY